MRVFNITCHFNKVIAVALTSLVMFSSCNEDKINAVDTGDIIGTVVQKGTNEPIENVKISTSPVSGTAFTNAEGNFRIKDVTVGDYSVEASKEGLLTSFEAAKVLADGEVNVVFELDISESANSAPTTPILSNPVDGATNIPITQEFRWSSSDVDSDDVLNYVFELKNENDNEIIMSESITDSSFTVNNLKFGTKYFWQVQVTDGINEPVFSAVNIFTTAENPNNRFHFVREENGLSRIISSNQNGSIAFGLTEEDQNSFGPKKNNTAGQIAFMRTVGTQTHIFTSDLDGDNVKQVTNSVPVAGFNLGEIDFDWSTNGSQLIYPNFDKLYVINKDGSGLRQLYETADGSLISRCAWSFDGSFIALQTNDVNGYNASVFTIDLSGTVLENVLTGVSGAAGGIDISVDGTKILYTYDVSNFQSASFRRLDSKIFSYDLNTDTATDLSTGKNAGTNDFDAEFSPNGANIIFVNTSNDGISAKGIYVQAIEGDGERTLVFNNASAPNWE
ncbi:carboxypeptidase regulatory-like domain-containing protein [Spongiivirga sp. MCCC 1A20706]|uniref:carboxypeptidase regulatory-like domain-containing protein n=1 Tax=Spongiivirga sp. MCCC 1A20706 TaxID=3160963 RepID=UPI0039774EDA